MQTFWIIAGVLAGVAAYFIPTLVALRRRVTNGGSVFAVNLFLGWSLIGWVVALAMALRTSTLPPAGGAGVGQWAGDIIDGIKGPRG